MFLDSPLLLCSGTFDEEAKIDLPGLLHLPAYLSLPLHNIIFLKKQGSWIKAISGDIIRPRMVTFN